MSLRLSRPPEGDSDPHEILSDTTDDLKESKILSHDPTLKLQIPVTRPPSLLPPELRRRLHEIVARSPNPTKSIAQFRSRFENLLAPAIPSRTPISTGSRPSQTGGYAPKPLAAVPATPIVSDSPPPHLLTAPISFSISVHPTNVSEAIPVVIEDSTVDDSELRQPTVRRAITGDFLADFAPADWCQGIDSGDYSPLLPLPPDPGGCTINHEAYSDILHQHAPHLFITIAIPRGTMAPGDIVAKKVTSGKGAAENRTEDAANTSTIIIPGGSGAAGAGPSCRRAGKAHVEDVRTEEERKPVIVNLAVARGQAKARLVAVGVFLSVISITSKQLISYMRNVWMIRGSLESLQLADRRFVLDFSLEGDFEHVTKGGPWRYQGDAVLVRELKDKEDPNTVQFDSMPIWVQFTKIPFYLLSKQLARDLARNLGELICIDNNARGDICDKILRARVRIPIARALQRWITLEDEISNEEVMVTVLYERLPSYCQCCGVIGHQEEACDLPQVLRKHRYSKDLGVPPTHFHDARKWWLADSAGVNGRALRMDVPWRNVAALGPRRPPAPTTPLALVARVAKEVEKLSVTDDNKHAGVPHAGNKDCDNAKHSAPPPTAPVETKAAIDTNKNDNTTASNTMVSTEPEAVGSAPRKHWKRQPKEVGDKGPSGKEDPVTCAKNKLIKQAANNTLATTDGGSLLGKRQGTALLLPKDDNDTKRSSKKMMMGEGVWKDGDPEEEGKQEATSPGATGQLTGAFVGACQEP